MTLAEIRDLFAFNAWANDRMIAGVDALSPEQRDRDLGSSFPTILATAAHIAGAEWVWLERWDGRSPTALPGWAVTPEWTRVRALFAELEAARAAFLSTLTEADLTRPVEFTLFNGTKDARPLQIQFQHVVNHGSYHRGQIAGMFRQVGARPPGTDLIRWARENV
jgi:uncharacterized damage-inducible protein DinB